MATTLSQTKNSCTSIWYVKIVTNESFPHLKLFLESKQLRHHTTKDWEYEFTKVLKSAGINFTNFVNENTTTFGVNSLRHFTSKLRNMILTETDDSTAAKII